MNDLNLQDYDYLFKILLLGDSNVGKSCIILRYTENTFNENILNSIGVDFKTKKVCYKEKIIKIQIWDTAGAERFKSITTSYYRGANAIVIVYDISDKESFNHVGNWLEEIDKHAKENVMRFLVGNKCDLEQKREVPKEDAENLSKKFHIPFIETSAKTTININKLFEMAIELFVSSNKNKSETAKNINLDKPEEEGKKGECCK